MSLLEAYGQRVKEIADKRASFDTPVSKERLVTKFVCQLSPENDVVGSLVNQ